jgi:transcriptional regulator with XRE-family HTH domain
MAKVKSVIRQHRAKLDLSQSELADLLNISSVTVSNWEQKKSTPSVHNMIRLAVHLEVSLEELMNDYKNKEVVK